VESRRHRPPQQVKRGGPVALPFRHSCAPLRHSCAGRNPPHLNTHLHPNSSLPPSKEEVRRGWEASSERQPPPIPRSLPPSSLHLSPTPRSLLPSFLRPPPSFLRGQEPARLPQQPPPPSPIHPSPLPGGRLGGGWEVPSERQPPSYTPISPRHFPASPVTPVPHRHSCAGRKPLRAVAALLRPQLVGGAEAAWVGRRGAGARPRGGGRLVPACAGMTGRGAGVYGSGMRSGGVGEGEALDRWCGSRRSTPPPNLPPGRGGGMNWGAASLVGEG